MNDEILPGYSVATFLQSDKCSGWNPDTRRYYANCLQSLLAFAQAHGPLTPQAVALWQAQLQKTYAPSAVNVHLAAANNYFRWCGRFELMRGHTRPTGKASPPPALTRTEYLNLLRAARTLGRQRIYLLVKLFATTDLPLQCLSQVTAELVRAGSGTLHCHGEALAFYCPRPLQQELLQYMALQGIYRGPVFITRSGKLLARPSIFRSIQELCRAAGVPEEKGNPRALRKLYQASQQELDRSLAALKRQMIDQAAALEQDAIGWQPPNDQDKPA